jgi:hypothetical protein
VFWSVLDLSTTIKFTKMDKKKKKPTDFRFVWPYRCIENDKPPAINTEINNSKVFVVFLFYLNDEL